MAPVVAPVAAATTTNSRAKANVRIVPVEAGDMDRASSWIYKAFQGDHVNDMMFPARKRVPAMTDEQRYKHVARSYEKRLESARQGKSDFLKAVDVETGAILGVAEWVKPGTPVKDAAPNAEKSKNDEDNPEMDYEYMNRFMGSLSDTREKYMGDRPHWFLSILCVAPEAQGRGVGGQLLAWGTQKADEADPPLPAYLEASPAGQPLYAAKGFKVVTEAPIHDKDEYGNITSSYGVPCMLRSPRQT